MGYRFHQNVGWCLKRAPLFIFVLALCVRLTIIFKTRTYLDIEHTEVVRIATSLATQGTFADAYGHNTGPTAHASPLYPILLSLVFRMFGTGVAGEIAQETFSSMIASLIYAALPTLSTACGLGLAPGIFAGLAGAVLPVNFWSETKGSFEAPLVGLLLMIFCIATARVWRSADFSVRWAVIMGFISGVALLASPSLAPVILASLFLSYALFRHTKAKECIRFCVIVLGIIALCLTPWAVRNYLVLGSVVWSRSNLGLELYISNNDMAAPNWYDNISSHLFDRSHPFSSRIEQRKLQALGELPYEHEKLTNAMHWIVTHPKRFTWLTLQRIYYFWFPRMRRRAQSILMGLFTVGAGAGLIRLLRSGNVTAWLFLGIVTLYPLIYYIVEAFARYRCPIDWVLIFLTAFWISSIVNSRVNFGRPRGLRISTLQENSLAR
jgi:4-amino-4-deoxy-L-arabinose transferase-like glycosyltransferase